MLPGYLPERVAYRRAADEGCALTETRFPSLNAKADELAQGIVDLLADLEKQKAA